MNSPQPAQRLTATQWLIVVVAVIGFAFDIYELLMLPLIAGPALMELLNVPPGDPQIRQWIGYLFWGSALSGGVFGLFGGYLTDRFGRKRVLLWSILIYSLSPVAAAFSTSAPMLLFFRCTTFIGVCVEFPAAIAWLAELFPKPKQREAVLGITQAFSSAGGILVVGANALAVKYATSFPAIHGAHSSWRYTLISGLIPALPIILLLPFLPESPAWKEKRAKGTLRRPRLSELFAPELRRTTLATTILFACAYGAAFGAIQLTPSQIVPGLPELAVHQKPLKDLKIQENKIRQQLNDAPEASPERAALLQQLKQTLGKERPYSDAIKQTANGVQFYQEMGGLAGRIVLALLVVVMVRRVPLLRLFQVPGLIIVPLVFFYAARHNLELLKWGMFFAGFLTVAQFSFWGNYLPRVYPTHLRGTGESFAANVGGRMLGTSAAFFTTSIIAPMMPGNSTYTQVALGAAFTAFLVYAVGVITSFWLPEPQQESLPE